MTSKKLPVTCRIRFDGEDALVTVLKNEAVHMTGAYLRSDRVQEPDGSFAWNEQAPFAFNKIIKVGDFARYLIERPTRDEYVDARDEYVDARVVGITEKSVTFDHEGSRKRVSISEFVRDNHSDR